MGDKATPKAMTGAMKACLFQAFAISTEETEDPDHQTPEETTGSRQAPPTRGQASVDQRKHLWAVVKRKYPEEERETALRDLIHTATNGRTDSTMALSVDEADGILKHLETVADREPADTPA